MRKILAALVSLTLPATLWAYEEELPQWEVGLGLAGINIPDYRGSDHRATYVLPLPLFIYRGDKVSVDRDGAQADLFKSKYIRLDFSMNAGPPAESSENGAREGMPDLDPTVEIGPVIKVLLGTTADRDHIFSLRLPVRAAFTTHLEHIGWVFTPHLNYDGYKLVADGRWNWGAAIGPVYANEKFHDYYYEVDPQYASAARPAYNAEGGYSGTQLTLSLNKRFRSFWLGVFARYDDLHGAAFADSPVVRKDSSLLYGVAMAWTLGRSEKTVRVVDKMLR